MRLQTTVDALRDDNSPEAKMLRDALKKGTTGGNHGPCRRATRRLCPSCRRSVAERDERVRLEQEYSDWRRFEWRLPNSAHHRRVGRNLENAEVVTELNQIAAERDALSQELRRSRAPMASSWSGDGRPDLNNVPPLPDDHHAIEEWMIARDCDLPDALEFGSADVISQVSNMLAQGASKMATLSRVSALALYGQSMDVQTSLGTHMCAVMQQTPSGGLSAGEGIEFSIDIEDTLSEV